MLVDVSVVTEVGQHLNHKETDGPGDIPLDICSISFSTTRGEKGRR